MVEAQGALGVDWRCWQSSNGSVVQESVTHFSTFILWPRSSWAVLGVYWGSWRNWLIILSTMTELSLHLFIYTIYRILSVRHAHGPGVQYRPNKNFLTKTPEAPYLSTWIQPCNRLARAANRSWGDFKGNKPMSNIPGPSKSQSDLLQ